jgi:hypothetical protein
VEQTPSEWKQVPPPPEWQERFLRLLRELELERPDVRVWELTPPPGWTAGYGENVILLKPKGRET